jgi:hypothetical protein
MAVECDKQRSYLCATPRGTAYRRAGGGGPSPRALQFDHGLPSRPPIHERLHLSSEQARAYVSGSQPSSRRPSAKQGPPLSTSCARWWGTGHPSRCATVNSARQAAGHAARRAGDRAGRAAHLAGYAARCTALHPFEGVSMSSKAELLSHACAGGETPADNRVGPSASRVRTCARARGEALAGGASRARQQGESAALPRTRPRCRLGDVHDGAAHPREGRRAVWGLVAGRRASLVQHSLRARDTWPRQETGGPDHPPQRS